MRKCKISDISKHISSGITPLKSNNSFWDSNDIFWLKTEQLGEYKIYETNEYISKKALEETNIKVFPEKTISVAMYGEGKTRGKVSIIATPMTTNQACCNIVIDEEKADYRYVYYWLKNSYYQLRQLSSGVRHNLNTDNIKDFEIDVKDRNIQSKIANMLEVLDDKIENNNKINVELENMARTIYDYWFLQFEFPNEEGKPYKSSGGKMAYNEELRKEIPIDWECKKMSELLKNNKISFDYRSIEKTIDMSIMPSNSIALNELNDSNNFSTNLFRMNEGDILFGSIRPYLHKAGIAPVNGTVAGTVYSYLPYNNDDYNFSLITMTSKNIFEYAVMVSSGTKMPVVSNDSLLNFKVPYDKEVVKKYNEIINLKDSIIHNVQENEKLKSVRDFLLPLLMNGQVTFKN